MPFVSSKKKKKKLVKVLCLFLLHKCLFKMFQSEAYIERRHGKNGTDRAYYLTQLVQEYTATEKKGISLCMH